MEDKNKQIKTTYVRDVARFKIAHKLAEIEFKNSGGNSDERMTLEASLDRWIEDTDRLELARQIDFLEIEREESDLRAKILNAKSVGDRIKLIRKNFHLNQGDLASLLDVTQATISRWEKNLVTPNEDIIEVLSHVAKSNPNIMRYGQQAFERDGIAFKDREVQVIGSMNTRGFVTLTPEPTIVPAPREGSEDYRFDIAGIKSETQSTLGLFPRDWILFYSRGQRDRYMDDLNDNSPVPRNTLSVIRIQNPFSIPSTGDILIGTVDSFALPDGTPVRTVRTISGEELRTSVIWATPVLSMRSPMWVDDTNNWIRSRSPKK